MAEWDETKRELLAKLWAQGLSGGEIAKRLGGGLTRSAILGKVHRLGLGLRGPQKAPKAVAAKAGEAWRPKSRKQQAGRAKAVALVNVGLPVEPINEKPTRTFATLEPKECKWPMGDPQKPEFGFCGAARIPDSTYCQHHHGIAYCAPDRSRASSTHRSPVPSSLRARAAIGGVK